MEPMTINYLAVAVAALAYLVLGGLWYSTLFGSTWMKAIGKTKEQVAASASPFNYVYALILGFVASYGIARIMVWSGEISVRRGILTGLVVGGTFILAAFVMNDVFEKRPTSLTFINVLYHIVALIIAGIIVGAWR